MSVNGIWTTELMSLYGWETTGVMLLEDGRVVGGSNIHYSVGSYEETGDRISVNVSIEFHGPPRTFFGASDKNLSIQFEGKIRDGLIEGSAHRTDKPGLDIAYRLRRRADIPPR